MIHLVASHKVLQEGTMFIKKIIRKVIPYHLRFLIHPLWKFLLHPSYRLRALYKKTCDHESVNQHMIFYEAYHGKSMTGNPYAVFKYLLNHPKYKHFRHVWAMIDIRSVPPTIKYHPRVTVVTYQSRDYVKYLALAKYLINDTTFPYYFHKRENQIYANIWHGTPLKTMGMDIKERGLADHKNIQRNFLFTDYFVSPNQYTYKKLLKSHDVYTLFNGSILDTGYPRVDLIYGTNQEKMRKLFDIDDEKKVILYAPTWRGHLGEKTDQSKKILEDVKEIQEKFPEMVVLVKAHYYAESFFKEQGFGHLIIQNSIDTNEVLSIIDILITDYSSIFFEFLLTKKPIIFYAYDETQYQKKRGTYIAMDDLPGPLCHTIDGVLDSIEQMDEISSHYKKTYEQFMKKFCYHDDGRATERFVDIVFEGKASKNLVRLGTDKTKILIYGGGFLNNGITASVINLLNIFDYNQFDVTLVDHGSKIKKSKITHMQKMNKNVHHIYRFGTWNANLADLWRHTLFLITGNKEIAPIHMYQREMERITGLTKFDVGIDFGGYSPLWAALFAFGDFKRNSIYLHSDMNKERDKKINNRYPHRRNLKAIFSLYDSFDKVISVSEYVHEKNRDNMKQFIKNRERKMDYVINAIDYRRVLSLGNRSADFQHEFGEEFNPNVNSLLKHDKLGMMEAYSGQEIFPLANAKATNFITIGRLSPEKDHMKLVESFYELTKTYPSVYLYIVGEGAMRNQIGRLISRLGLADRVMLTGQLDNPYLLLSSCDCFVLSSNYEGQAIVLLEALILGVPVITTDIPGPRSIVDDGYGLIVDNSRDGLTKGMQQFLNGTRFSERKFDYKEYQQNALNMFYNKICK